MTTRYIVKYRILPAEAGPDDYEPGDLPLREEEFDLSDPEPAGTVAGQELRYGPHHHEVEAAVQQRLTDTEKPLIIRCRIA
ncbi:hypothetical protein [Streptomyces sp. ME18-1-4]|uniref:hypothetical protein n=1 Tax=Streptomyces sp. ME18-1-4 TaxID=3028685 RepID=UPI0029A6401C|nr:hypothetical protein [Streptomyces sp. ME18-1-4]MDX3243682.1 hypothetical protein [Streptomyces sp. ME18-1-4]